MGFGTAAMYRRMRERSREMDRKNHEWFEKQEQENPKQEQPKSTPPPPVEPQKEDV